MKDCLFGFLLVTLLLSIAVQAGERKKVGKNNKEMPELHHVLDVELLKEMEPPKEFELGDDQKITCKTCHGIKDIEDIPNDEVDKDDIDFLRGGPYPILTDFCYNCHDKKANTRPNIHEMLDEKGEAKEEHCEFCHEEVLDRDKEYDLKDTKLRMVPEILCFGCHLKTPHMNALNHQVEPDDKKRDQLKKSVKELGLYMPLSKEGKIMCVTCHISHQDGVLDDKFPSGKQVADTDLEEGVTYEKHPWNVVFQADKKARLDELEKKTGERHTLKYQRIKTEVLLRLPAKDGSLCLVCHAFEK